MHLSNYPCSERKKNEMLYINMRVNEKNLTYQLFFGERNVLESSIFFLLLPRLQGYFGIENLD